MNSEARDVAGVISLLAAILRGVPKLEGALCKNRHTLFTDFDDIDPDEREYAAEQASAVCQECPVLWKCAAQPASRLHGVVAGRVYNIDIKRAS